MTGGCVKTDEHPGPQKRKVVDYFGKDIYLPEKVERVISTASIVSEYLCVLGAKDKIVGIGRVRSGNSVFQRLYPDIIKLPSVGIREVSLEKVAALDPDVVLCGHDKQLIENIERLNIIAVGTFPRDMNGLFEQIRITGIVVNKEEEADTVINFLRERLKFVGNRISNIPDSRRPSIYYVRMDPLETLGKGIYSEIVHNSGGRNVVQGLGEGEVPVIVSLENIYDWNPEIIFIRDSSPVMPSDLYDDPKWKGIAAVREKRIYKEHKGWSEFRVETVFGIMEKAKWLHPDLFKDMKPEEDQERFFRLAESFYH